jgi:hypothetical protein
MAIKDPSRQDAISRLGALAALSRPMQHDLNNLLTVVFANLEMLKRSAGEGAPQRQLDRIQQAARRLEVSTRAMNLVLGRPAGVAPMRLSECLLGLQPLLALVLPAPGALVLEPAEMEPSILLDRAALEAALIALVREAQGALGRGEVLRIAVRPDAALELTRPARAQLPALAVLASLAEAAEDHAEATQARLLLRFSPP